MRLYFRLYRDLRVIVVGAQVEAVPNGVKDGPKQIQQVRLLCVCPASTYVQYIPHGREREVTKVRKRQGREAYPASLVLYSTAHLVTTRACL